MALLFRNDRRSLDRKSLTKQNLYGRWVVVRYLDSDDQDRALVIGWEDRLPVLWNPDAPSHCSFWIDSLWQIAAIGKSVLTTTR